MCFLTILCNLSFGLFDMLTEITCDNYDCKYIEKAKRKLTEENEKKGRIKEENTYNFENYFKGGKSFKKPFKSGAI